MSGMGEVSIKLVSAGTTPTGLALETVRDPAVYDFDPTRRLYLSQLAQAHRRRPEATLPLPWSTSIHPDQAALSNRPASCDATPVRSTAKRWVTAFTSPAEASDVAAG